MVLSVVLLLFASIALVQGDECSGVANVSKIDCKRFSKQDCENVGCCWSPAGTNSTIPWCFFKTGASPCNPAIFGSNDTSVAPFSDSEIDLMRSYFLANLNYGGVGAVLASPDGNVLNGQGGSYRYHWSRDGALSMRTMLQTFVPGVTNASLVPSYMLQYTKFILKIHSQQDPFNQPILTEPKFFLNGSVYSGGWCRPQNDGPSLRAITLMMYAQQLIQNGQIGLVKQYLWTGNDNIYGGGAIKRDLDWAATGWNTNTCDLWEELQSNDFFWNRMSHNRALYSGASFAKLMGDTASASRYSQAQQQVAATLLGHWNGKTLIESSNHPLDGATLAALNDGVADDQPTVFGPTSMYVAGTVKTLIEAFCAEYPINNQDTENGVPGTLIGRYPGDHYGGGNPWILLTNHLALLFYRGASYTAETGSIPDVETMGLWGKIMPHLNPLSNSPQHVADSFLAAGDGVLQRIRYHVAGDNFHLAEQLDKHSGYEYSATDLTWSYGTMLKAVWYRSLAAKAIKKLK